MVNTARSSWTLLNHLTAATKHDHGAISYQAENATDDLSSEHLHALIQGAMDDVLGQPETGMRASGGRFAQFELSLFVGIW